jgi:hypothetical protein
MVTPYGNQTYTPGATPTDRPTLTQTLSPEEQQKLGLSQTAQIGALGTLNDAIPYVRDALLGPFGMAGSPLQGGYNPGYAPQAGMQYDPGDFGQYQTGLNFEGAPPMPEASDATREAVTQSLYEQGARFLDPQWQQAEDKQTAALANQGITRGSEAFQTEYQNLNDAKSRAYGDLVDRSISGGVGAMQDLYGMAMQGRQQGVGEIGTQGQFLNAAQQQAANQLLSRMSQRNAGIASQAGIAANEAGLEGNQRAQAFGEYSANRTMPLNMLNALLSSSQVNNPQFQQTQPTSISPPPVYQGAVDQGNYGAAQQQGLFNLIGGLGSSYLGRPR